MIESDFGASAQAYSGVHVFSAGKAASAGVAESCGDKTISHPSRPGGHCCQAVVTHDIPPLTPELQPQQKGGVPGVGREEKNLMFWEFPCSGARSDTVACGNGAI